MEKIFISYKRANKDVVFPLVKGIEESLGVKCWVDLDGIESSAQFASKICTAIDNAEVVLFMHSSAHLDIDFENDWTVKELNYAHVTNKKVVLVKLDDAPLKNIFLMNYGTKNNIDSNVPEQMEKLLKDLGCWLKLDEVEDITSQVLLEKGKDLYLDGEYEEGLKWVRKAADMDNVDALNFLAEKYKLGGDVPLDIPEAVRCYKRAVELGDDFAQLQLDLLKMLGVIE